MNIELHGFTLNSEEEKRDIEADIWSKLRAVLVSKGYEDEESVLTIVPCQTSGHSGRISPFIRVFSKYESDFELVAQTMRYIRLPGSGMETFVECVLLNKCIKL